MGNSSEKQRQKWEELSSKPIMAKHNVPLYPPTVEEIEYTQDCTKWGIIYHQLPLMLTFNGVNALLHLKGFVKKPTLFKTTVLTLAGFMIGRMVTVSFCLGSFKHKFPDSKLMKPIPAEDTTFNLVNQPGASESDFYTQQKPRNVSQPSDETRELLQDTHSAPDGGMKRNEYGDIVYD